MLETSLLSSLGPCRYSHMRGGTVATPKGGQQTLEEPVNLAVLKTWPIAAPRVAHRLRHCTTLG